MTAGSDAGRHPLIDDLVQQAISGENTPRLQADLTAANVTATGPFHADLATSEHNLAGRGPMPIPDPAGEPGVLRSDLGFEFGMQQHLEHGQPCGRC